MNKRITFEEVEMKFKKGNEFIEIGAKKNKRTKNNLFDDQHYKKAEGEYDEIVLALDMDHSAYPKDSVYKIADKYHELGKNYHFFNKEDAIRNYKKSIELRNEIRRNYSDNNSHKGESHSDSSNIIKAFENYKETTLKLSSSHNNIGLLCFNSGDITEALNHQKKAYQLRDEINDKLNKGKACLEMGRCYDEIGEYEKAKSKYDEALENLIESNGKEKDKYELIAWNNIGAVYLNMDKNKEAIPYLKSCLPYRKKNNQISKLKITYNNLGIAYLGLGEYEKALLNFKESLILCGETADSIRMNGRWNSIGVLLSMQGKFDEAKIAIRDSAIIKIPYCDANSKEFNSLYAASYGDLSYVFLKEGIPDSAIHYSQMALDYLLGTDNTHFPSSNSIGIINKVDFLDYQYKLAQGLIAKGNLQKSLNVLFYCDSVIIQSMRRSHTFDQSKLFWQGRTRNIYEDAIKIALELGEIETAFNFSQKSKALTLLGRINANSALEEANLPEEVINEKRKLESRIISLENKIGTENFSMEKLNQARDEYEEFIASLEKDYPKYYTLKYNTKTPSVKEIKNSLLKNNKEVIIEYFLGDSAIYIFGITKKEGINYHVLENRNDILKNIKELNKLSINRFSKSDEFSKISNKVYQELIAPITYEIKGINKLIVAPDDSLFLIPFKALVMEESDNSFKELPYMVKEYTINECYSSTFLYTIVTNNKNSTKGLNEIKVLGVAPEFNGNNSYGILKENIKGVRQGIHFFNKETSDTLFREQATAERFIQQLDTGNYDIVYISSHAEKGEQNKNENTIILHESELQQNEIEGLWTSDVKMIVLSACKTGDGETVKGEAPISLGWGFASTNVPSITASLWNMDDETANILMKNYFDKLVSHKRSKSQALTEGIQIFLEGNEVGYHPYYWAGVIHYGDDRAIVSSDWSLLLIVGSILMMVFLLLGFYLKSQNFLS